MKVLVILRRTWYNEGGRTNIEIFTYSDYLKYSKIIITKEVVDKKNKVYVSGVGEEVELYKINQYDEKELLKEESFISKAMLIEKARYTNSLPKYLGEIIKEINEKTDIYTNEQKRLLITIINLVLNTKLEDNEKEKLTKKLKGEDENMLAVLEMIEEENKRLLARGERKGRRDVAKKMLKENLDKEIILRVTGISKKELERIAK